MIKTACFLFLTPILIPLLQGCVVKGNIILSSFQRLNSYFSSDVIFLLHWILNDHICGERMLLTEKWSTFFPPKGYKQCKNICNTRYGSDTWYRFVTRRSSTNVSKVWSWPAQLLLNTPVSKCMQHIKWLSFCVSPTKTRLSKGTQTC